MNINELQPDPTQSTTQAALTSIADLIVGIDHIAIAVPNLESAIAWYRDVLGFSAHERRTTQGETTGMLSAVMVAGSAVVVLIQGMSPSSQVNRFIEHFGPGVQHLAFKVHDLDAAIARVRANCGKADTEEIREEGIRQIFLRRDESSAVRVELIERKGGNFTDKSVERLFRILEKKDLF